MYIYNICKSDIYNICKSEDAYADCIRYIFPKLKYITYTLRQP